MRSCLHSVSLPDRPILDVMRRAAAAGYRGVELNAETLPWAGPHVTPQTSADDRRAIRDAARAADLHIPAVGAHIAMVEADPRKRRAAADYVLGCIDLAADLGSPVVHILSGALSPGHSRAQAWPWFADAVAETTDHARRKGVLLAVEAIAGHLFCGTDDYHRLRADLPGVAFRVNFDPSHLIVQGEDPMRVVDELADRIVHVHLKDGAGRFPAFTFPPLGRGEIDFPALVEGLRRAGYAGSMSVEYEAQVYGFALSDDEILASGRDFLSTLEIA
ncbi:MAG TPA: sugar phosphate isomerase/epimerase [Lichenihabitans sp.]|jgi:sugar phosphate isomerase/epimerase|nr:sugar phosphate isomerase/epimerase [Lichenihabitans sp.]